ncbi:MAG: hypothetical protein ACI8TP_001301 [Acidimicrobiales bacterium]|jgi:hypothetical protein
MFGRFKKDKTPGLEDLANAPVGAATSIDGSRGVIRGSLILDEAGDRWIEHWIQDQNGRMYWVSIENYDRTVATLWEDIEVFEIQGGPGDSKISYKDQSFRRSENGTANFQATGETQTVPAGTLDYVDFEGPDGARLSFERFGEEGAGRRTRAITGNCPNCGAPIDLDVAGRCTSCMSEVMTEHGWWGSWEASVGRRVTDSARLQ